MTGGRKRGFDLYGLCPYNTVTGSKTIIQNETGGFEHAVSSGREQKPNVLSAEPRRQTSF